MLKDIWKAVHLCLQAAGMDFLHKKIFKLAGQWGKFVQSCEDTIEK